MYYVTTLAFLNFMSKSAPFSTLHMKRKSYFQSPFIILESQNVEILCGNRTHERSLTLKETKIVWRSFWSVKHLAREKQKTDNQSVELCLETFGKTGFD